MSTFETPISNTSAWKRSQQHHYILPNCITADVGLSVSRQLARWIQDDHQLEVLILRGPASHGNNIDMLNANTNSHGANAEDGGIPPYLVGLLQDLILTKTSWKRIELSGRAPRATERILQSTMIQREGGTQDLSRRTSQMRRRDRKPSTRFVQTLEKLVIENATSHVLNSVSSVLCASTPPSASQSSEAIILGTTDIHTLALRWTDFSVVSVQALSRGFLLQSPSAKIRTHPLRGLLLTGSTIQEDAIPLLAQMLQSAVFLEELSLTDCHLEDQEAGTIIDALHETPHPKLRSLDMSCNLLQEEATLALTRLTRKRTAILNQTPSPTSESLPALLTLDISNQDVWDGRSYVEPLMKALVGIEENGDNFGGTSGILGRTSAVVTAVDCMYWSHSFLDDFHIRQLCQCFTRSLSNNNTVNLQKLVLRGNMIDDAGLEYIAEALPAMQHLQYLDLRLNPRVTESVADRLAAALQELHFKDDAWGVLPSGRSLWHIFLDQPTQSFMMELALHRAGKSWLLREEERGSTLPAGLWPLVFERVGRCIEPEKDDLDEEICIHGVFCVDLMFDLFRLGYSSFLNCR